MPKSAIFLLKNRKNCQALLHLQGPALDPLPWQIPGYAPDTANAV